MVLHRAGQTYQPGKEPNAFVRVVSAGYVPTLGIALREGRVLDIHDSATGPRMVVVSECMARAGSGQAKAAKHGLSDSNCASSVPAIHTASRAWWPT